MSTELDVAISAAKRAAEISRGYYLTDLEVTTKADRTPVTEADVECERAIRDIVMQAFPQHGFYGEETGEQNVTADSVWLVDPIDGTKSFVRQYPFFSTQIALMRGGEIVLGVSSGTMFDELAWAERGSGAWLNGKRIGVSDIVSLRDAAVSTGNVSTLATGAGWPVLGQHLATAGRTRGYGDFYHYHLLAAGKIDAVIESDVNVLDIAALSVILSEAGGVFTDLNGAPVNLETRSVLAANPQLHRQLLTSLRGLVHD